MVIAVHPCQILNMNNFFCFVDYRGDVFSSVLDVALSFKLRNFELRGRSSTSDIQTFIELKSIVYRSMLANRKLCRL